MTHMIAESLVKPMAKLTAARIEGANKLRVLNTKGVTAPSYNI